MVASQWGCECQRYFIQTDEVNKKGNAKSIPVEVRKMHIRGSFLFTDYFRVVLVKRKAGNIYSVKQRKKPERAWWDKTPIKDEDCKMVKEGSYTREQFLAWLVHYVPNPMGACVELETCPPDVEVAAA
jgi:hypothetical protein